MNWAPSTIYVVEDRSFFRKDKKVYLVHKRPEMFSGHNKSVENIFVGAEMPGRRRLLIRPVMLATKYDKDLFFDAEQIPEDGRVVVVEESVGTTFNELSSAMKESMRVEKAIIQRLERSEEIEKSKYYITTKAKSFYVSKQRLLGEILKAHRKIERVKPLTVLSVQASLEAFIKKLCLLKVVFDKLCPEEPDKLCL